MQLSIFKNWSISRKIATMASVVTLVPIIILSWMAVNQATDALNGLGHADLEQIAGSVRIMCEIQRDTVAAKLKSDLGVIHETLVGFGGEKWQQQVSRSGDQAQSSKFSPVLVGQTALTGNESLVREWTEETGAYCSIYRMDNDTWSCTATTVPSELVARDELIDIRPGSTVYRSVKSGEVCTETRMAGDRCYETGYLPVQDGQGSTVGVIAVIIPYDAFTDFRKAIDSIVINESGYVYAINSRGVFTLHLSKLYTDTSNHAFIREQMDQREGWLEYDWEGRKKVGSYVYFEPFDWIITASSYQDEFNSAAAELRNKMIIGAVCAGIAAILVGLFIARRIAGGINKVTLAINDIAEGEGDLTKRLPVVSNDEVGRLAGGFNMFVDKVHDIIVEVANASREVASASNQIAAGSEEMAQGMKQQSDQTTQVSSAVEEMSSTVIEVARKSADASANAEKAGQRAEEGGQVVKQTIEGMNTISREVTASSEAVSELGKRGEQIGEIISVINDIADQTNLLALNAAIEAARAGEHGRGFAVVADEVRKLAERTTKATEEVSESIKAIQSETSSAVQRMNVGTESVTKGVEQAVQAGESLGKIVEDSQMVARMIQSIAAAAEEQSAAAEQISRNIENINAVTKQSAEGASQSAAAATQLSRKSEDLQRIVGRFKLAVN